MCAIRARTCCRGTRTQTYDCHTSVRYYLPAAGIENVRGIEMQPTVAAAKQQRKAAWTRTHISKLDDFHAANQARRPHRRHSTGTSASGKANAAAATAATVAQPLPYLGEPRRRSTGSSTVWPALALGGLPKQQQQQQQHSKRPSHLTPLQISDQMRWPDSQQAARRSGGAFAFKLARGKRSSEDRDSPRQKASRVPAFETSAASPAHGSHTPMARRRWRQVQAAGQATEASATSCRSNSSDDEDMDSDSGILDSPTPLMPKTPLISATGACALLSARRHDGTAAANVGTGAATVAMSAIAASSVGGHARTLRQLHLQQCERSLGGGDAVVASLTGCHGPRLESAKALNFR